MGLIIQIKDPQRLSIHNGVAVDVSYFSDKGNRNPSFLHNGVEVDESNFSKNGNYNASLSVCR